MTSQKQPETVTCHDISGKSIVCKTTDVSFRPSVYGFVFHDNKVLLGRHSNGTYDVPGGGVEIHESLDKALAREMKEETGLVVKARSIVDIRQSFFYLPASKKPVNAILIFYVCTCHDFSTLGQVTMDVWEEERGITPTWVLIDDLKESDFMSNLPSLGILKKAFEMHKEM